VTLSDRRAAHLRWVNELALFFHEVGFPSVRRATGAVAKPIRQVLDHGNLIGLPWTLAVRNQQNLNLSAAVDEVADEAALNGTQLFASIQRRHGSADTVDAYVTMPLHVFVKVLYKLHPELIRGSISSRIALHRLVADGALRKQRISRPPAHCQRPGWGQ